MEAVGEAVLSALLQPLFEKLASSELLKFASKKHLNGELDKWKRRLQEIHEVLNDAEEKQITTPSVKDWLSKLQDLAYDADDVLDEFATEATAKKVREKSQASTSKVQTLIPTSWNNLKPSAVRRNVELGSRLTKITARLQEIVTEKDALKLRTNDEQRFKKVNEREATTSLVKEQKVYGRERDKEAIVEWLLSGETSTSNFSAISIVGMGGVGKTTLAQCVYNDERVEFERKAWACVSDNFDIDSISKAILSHWERCEAGLNNLNLVQVKLKEKLNGKKFLIVLDDVWNENYERWTTLCSPFFAGAPGSKVIITTRSKDVSSMVGSALSYELQELSNDDCLSLFTQHALDAENFDQHSDLKEMGQEIVKRCKGLPLAAKTLGGLLRGKQHFEWEVILNSKIWELDAKNSGILPSLRLSYHHLPSPLKQCFAFCAVFPKDFEFSEDDLVLLWMAEGFIQQPKKQMRMEMLGHLYFQDLVSRSFFQQSAGDKSKYVMHDLISDLAQFVSKGICFNLDDKVEGENYKSLAEVRYMAFTRHMNDISKRFELLHQMRGLRMLLPLPIRDYLGVFYLSSHVVNNLVPKLKTLRVLSLAGYRITELPSSITGLKHLRLLNLSHSEIEMLPESLCELYNMQTLILFGCENLTRLPDGLGNLINLHHLDIRGTGKLQEMPLGMGNLINLSILSKFVVGKDKRVGVGELKELSNIQGEISIEGLDNVVKIQDAEDANLKRKCDLRRLSLEWSSRFDESRDKNHEEQVLNALRPHQNIENLTISGFAGTSFPSWVGDVSFSNMVHLELIDCRNVTSMPPLGGLPSLSILGVSGMDGIKELGLEFYGEMPLSSQPKVLFPSLERLTFWEMSNWEQWSNKPIEETTAIFPNLRYLSLMSCPKLAQMYLGCLPLLENLHVEDCQQLVEWSNKPIEETTAIFPNLRYLYLMSCPKLAQMYLGCLPLLENLHVGDCQQLVEWSNKPIEETTAIFPNLRYLYLMSCPKLAQMYLGCLPLLKSLRVWDCQQLVEWSNKPIEETTAIFPNLRYLYLMSCPKLAQMYLGCLPLLKSLRVWDCQQLVEWSNKPIEETTAIFPNLRDLELGRCPKLVQMYPGCLPLLKSLRVEDCQQLVEWSGKLPSLSALSILQCNKMLLENVPDLSSLTRFEIRSISGLEYLNKELVDSLEALEHIIIGSCDNLKYLWQDEIDLKKLDCLKRMKLEHCKEMVSLVEGGKGPMPCNLQEMSISYCPMLKKLANGFRNLTHLKLLEIEGCEQLTSLNGEEEEEILPSNLERLKIRNCVELEKLPNGFKNLTHLSSLDIYGCPKLEVFSPVGLPYSITDCRIDTFTLLNVLPEGITKHGDENIPSLNLRSLKGLCIPYVFLGSVLRSVPNLTSLEDLTIWGSPGDLNIREADNLSALSNLTSLRSLSIKTGSMESFAESGLPPNLTDLAISCSENLKQPMSEWGLHRLTSLTSLEIYGPSPSTDTLVSFPQLQLQTSLKEIKIFAFNNLKSISSDIRHLISLETLGIWDCPKLRCLPKSGLPPTLESLEILECPLLKAKECIKKYVHITANVPAITINDYQIIGGKAIHRPMFSED